MIKYVFVSEKYFQERSSPKGPALSLWEAAIINWSVNFTKQGWPHLDKGKCGYYYLSAQVKRGTLSPPNRRWRWVAIKESCRVQTLWTISPRSRLSHSRLRPLSTVHHHQMQKIRGERKKEKSYNFLFYFSSILRWHGSNWFWRGSIVIYKIQRCGGEK